MFWQTKDINGVSLRFTYYTFWVFLLFSVWCDSAPLHKLITYALCFQAAPSNIQVMIGHGRLSLQSVQLSEHLNMSQDSTCSMRNNRFFL